MTENPPTETVTRHTWAALGIYESADSRECCERWQAYEALVDARKKELPLFEVVIRAAGSATHTWTEPNAFNIPEGVRVPDRGIENMMLLTTELPIRRYTGEWFEAAEAALEP